MNMKYWGHCLLFMLGLASVCSCTDSEKIVHYRGIAVDDVIEWVYTANIGKDL